MIDYEKVRKEASKAYGVNFYGCAFEIYKYQDGNKNYFETLENTSYHEAKKRLKKLRSKYKSCTFGMEIKIINPELITTDCAAV